MKAALKLWLSYVPAKKVKDGAGSSHIIQENKVEPIKHSLHGSPSHDPIRLIVLEQLHGRQSTQVAPRDLQVAQSHMFAHATFGHNEPWLKLSENLVTVACSILEI